MEWKIVFTSPIGLTFIIELNRTLNWHSVNKGKYAFIWKWNKEYWKILKISGQRILKMWGAEVNWICIWKNRSCLKMVNSERILLWCYLINLIRKVHFRFYCFEQWNRRQAKDGMNRGKKLHFLIISFAYFKRTPCDRCMPEIAHFPNDFWVLDERVVIHSIWWRSPYLCGSSKEHAMQPTKGRRTHLTWLGSTQLVVSGTHRRLQSVVLTHFT